MQLWTSFWQGTCRGFKRKRGEDDLGLVPSARPAALANTAAAAPEGSMAAARRMYERGIRIADIAHALQLDERNVAMALVKRARKSDGLEIAAGREDREGPIEMGAVQRAGALHLAARLQHDPPELVCPILHVLMDDPVVAEDGNTYERQGIESALSHRSRSPMTNEPMGEVMLPNRALKSKIEEYKEVVVAEILSVAPCLVGESPEDAGVLLTRAEEFVRPKLPDRAARRRLLESLRLRARLPPPHREGAAAELTALLAQDDEPSVLDEVLDSFHALFDVAGLRQLDEDAAWKLFQLSRASQARPTSISCSLGSELVQRVAHRLGEEDAEAVAALERLWQVLLELSSIDAEAWVECAAVVLAFCPDRLAPDARRLSTGALLRSCELAEDAEALQAVAVQRLGRELPEALGSGGSPSFARVLCELASRQESAGDLAAASRSLSRASALDPTSREVHRTLLSIELHRLQAGSRVDEPALIALLHTADGDLNQHLAKRLRLEPEDLRATSVPALLTLADKLAALGCGVAASRAAAAAAQQQAAAGEPAAVETFRWAFTLDCHNEAAAEGVFQSSVAASQRCSMLEEQLRSAQDETARLQARCLELQEQLQAHQSSTQLCSPLRSRILRVIGLGEFGTPSPPSTIE